MRALLLVLLCLVAPALAAPMPSGLSQAFSAALDEGEWPERVLGTPLDRVLRDRVLRLGRPAGFDDVLGDDLARRIGDHYGVPDLEVRWVETNEPLVAGLKRGDFDAAVDAPGQPPFTLPGGYQASELSEVLSAAFREFASRPGRYADLYEKYFGVRREAPAEGGAGRWIAKATPGSTLDRVIGPGRIRFGFRRASPYWFTRENGEDAGFEFELGNALVGIMREHYPGLKVEWVEQPFTSDGSGLENYLLYDSLEPALLRGDFDVALAGLIRCPDRPVGVAAADLDLYCTAVYTGRDGWDVSSLRGGTRDDLVAFLGALPRCTIVHTAGGPTQEAAEALVADVAAAGGNISGRLATPAELVESLTNQTDHFVLGDALALSGAVLKLQGFSGLNTGIVLQGGDYLAPVTALDP